MKPLETATGQVRQSATLRGPHGICSCLSLAGCHGTRRTGDDPSWTTGVHCPPGSCQSGPFESKASQGIGNGNGQGNRNVVSATFPYPLPVPGWGLLDLSTVASHPPPELLEQLDCGTRQTGDTIHRQPPDSRRFGKARQPRSRRAGYLLGLISSRTRAIRIRERGMNS
jgi:hypothetical protein